MADSTHSTVEDLYTTLGVERDATAQDIKRAFRRIARECHPDVAGEDATAAERFKRARLAYETLVDPVERARYDRRRQPHPNPFGGDWWGFSGADGASPHGGGPTGGRPGNDLDLEDIFNDFGAFSDFGFGGRERPAASASPGTSPGPSPGPRHAGERPGAPPPRAPTPGAVREERRDGGEAATPGADVKLKVQIPADLAERGGALFVRYQRLRRTEDGTGLEAVQELHELRVPPGTRHGETLRDPRMGHAGEGFAPPGDLLCEIALAGAAKGTGAGAGAAGAGPSGSKQDPLPLPVSVSEALLGGRVEISTARGPVRVVVPPCTSSGTLLRIKRRAKPDGAAPEEIYLQIQVVMPPSLDEQSRALVLEFARLNAYDPRA